jgi:hypothetical protein
VATIITTTGYQLQVGNSIPLAYTINSTTAAERPRWHYLFVLLHTFHAFLTHSYYCPLKSLLGQRDALVLLLRDNRYLMFCEPAYRFGLFRLSQFLITPKSQYEITAIYLIKPVVKLPVMTLKKIH